MRWYTDANNINELSKKGLKSYTSKNKKGSIILLKKNEKHK